MVLIIGDEPKMSQRPKESVRNLIDDAIETLHLLQEFPESEHFLKELEWAITKLQDAHKIAAEQSAD